LEADEPRDAAVEPARVPRAAAPPPVRAWTDLTLGFRE